MQSLSVTADIPPEESALAGDATVRAWISETNTRARVREPFEDPYYEPLYFTETLRFTDKMSLRHYMVYDPELSDFTILTTSFNWGGFTSSFTATRSRGYSLNTMTGQEGWYINPGTETLNPQELSMGYQKSKSLNEGGRVSLEGNINTGLSFDLQRYTYSKYYFTLGIITKINRFLDVALSSHSENAQIFRYFQGLPFFGDVNVDMPGEKNILVDFVNSYRFNDVSKRTASGFKLKSFNLELVHHLGDWDATLGVKLAPQFDTTLREYRFHSEISFTIQWKPIREFRTEMKYDTDEGFSYE
jgi:hypothetical protein